jgi:hypothetical protein
LRAACTSRAALSILRLMSNWTEIEAVPSELVEVSAMTPGISPRRRSSHVWHHFASSEMVK